MPLSGSSSAPEVREVALLRLIVGMNIGVAWSRSLLSPSVHWASRKGSEAFVCRLRTEITPCQWGRDTEARDAEKQDPRRHQPARSASLQQSRSGVLRLILDKPPRLSRASLVPELVLLAFYS